MTKSTKSQQGGLAPSSYRTSCGVHELVARSSAWQVRAAQGKAKTDSLTALRNFNYTTRANIAHEEAEQIRARITCTPAESARRARFTATDEVLLQYIAETNPISPCSHPYFCQKLNREVRRSPTWHSSESESALERFEPVAVTMLWSDGQGTLFAPVAARRQKEFKRGILSSFCPFRSFRTSEKNSERKES